MTAKSQTDTAAQQTPQQIFNRIATVTIDDEGHRNSELQQVLVAGYSALKWAYPLQAAVETLETLTDIVRAASQPPAAPVETGLRDALIAAQVALSDGGVENTPFVRDALERINEALAAVKAAPERCSADKESARELGETIVAETERLLELEAAFFVSLVSNGLPADVGEMLTHGSARQGIPPRLIQKAIKATIPLNIERERAEARQLVIEANNSLYGSQGYFHSLNGGAFDKYHLSRGIEDLKASLRAQPQTPSMIPTEITKDMALAGRKALAAVADRMEEAKLLATSSVDFWQRVGHEPANEIYAAMVAVALSRPHGRTDEGK